MMAGFSLGCFAGAEYQKHLLNGSNKLERRLEQIPDEQREGNTMLKAMSTSDLEALKAKYKNPSVTKLIDGILEARDKGTKQS
jgi:hypothetical protein